MNQIAGDNISVYKHRVVC